MTMNDGWYLGGFESLLLPLDFVFRVRSSLFDL
jgi:hypothetical protein